MTPLKHYVHPAIVSSRRPIDITLIGAGGTGSQVLSGLARMNQALKALGSSGFHVRVFDGDSVLVTSTAVPQPAATAASQRRRDQGCCVMLGIRTPP